jgi:excisionase family DNA binding protein
MTSGIDRLMTLEEAAKILGTKLRFTRRLVAERRIRFTHVGRHVRIPESALREFINAGMVEPVIAVRKGRAA